MRPAFQTTTSLEPSVQPPLPEWGLMISAGRKFLFEQWWVATMPGLAIFIVSLGFNLLGDGLRDGLPNGSVVGGVHLLFSEPERADALDRSTIRYQRARERVQKCGLSAPVLPLKNNDTRRQFYDLFPIGTKVIES